MSGNKQDNASEPAGGEAPGLDSVSTASDGTESGLDKTGDFQALDLSTESSDPSKGSTKSTILRVTGKRLGPIFNRFMKRKCAGSSGCRVWLRPCSIWFYSLSALR